MILKNKYYKIKVYTRNSTTGLESELTFNFNDYLKSVEVSTFNPVDFYDLSGEPRKASIELCNINDYTQFQIFRNIFSESYLLEDLTPSAFSGGVFKISPFVNENPGNFDKVVFPGWYSTIGVSQAPILDEDAEINGVYLDYNDIYIRRNSEFLNVYVKIYLVENDSDALGNGNIVYTGMVERESVKINPSKNTIKFETLDGLGPFYDALKKYENFITACQDEDNNGNSINNSGISLSNFIFKVANNLTKYPYGTLFSVTPWADISHPEYEYTYNPVTGWLTFISAFQPGTYSFGGTYCFVDGAFFYVVHLHTFIGQSSSGNYWVGLKIGFSTVDGAVILEDQDDIDIYEYGQSGIGEYGAAYDASNFFNYGGVDTLFEIDVDASAYQQITENIVEYTISGQSFSVNTLAGEYSALVRIFKAQRGVYTQVDLELFELCTSFNTTVSPMDMIRLTCLVTGQYLIADGYKIEFRPLDALLNAGTNFTIDFNKIVQGEIEEFTQLDSLYDFTEIESVTLWEDTDINADDGKQLKPRLKEKLRLLRNTKKRIRLKIPLDENEGFEEMKWGDIIAISNKSIYAGLRFFIYNIDSSGLNTIVIEAFRL